MIKNSSRESIMKNTVSSKVIEGKIVYNFRGGRPSNVMVNKKKYNRKKDKRIEDNA
jgi:hypothetical protein